MELVPLRTLTPPSTVISFKGMGSIILIRSSQCFPREECLSQQVTSEPGSHTPWSETPSKGTCRHSISCQCLSQINLVKVHGQTSFDLTFEILGCIMKSEPTGWFDEGTRGRWEMPDFPGRVLRMWLDGNEEKGKKMKKSISGLGEGPNHQNKPACYSLRLIRVKFAPHEQLAEQEGGRQSS